MVYLPLSICLHSNAIDDGRSIQQHYFIYNSVFLIPALYKIVSVLMQSSKFKCSSKNTPKVGGLWWDLPLIYFLITYIILFLEIHYLPS